ELEQTTATRDELQNRLAELEAQLAASGDHGEWQQKYEADKQAWESEREKFVQERDKLSMSFRQVQQQLEQARKAEESSAVLEELEHKFELAVADVQALRQRNAELEQELARRPETDGADAA